MCKAEVGSPLHMWWTCPCLAALDDAAVQQTQKWVPTAQAEAVSLACFWFRGLLPQNLVDQYVKVPPPDEVSARLIGDLPVGGWPSGSYYTDGSGGDFSSLPTLRRVGSGVAYLGEGYHSFLFGAYAPVPGDLQTVPRSDLVAAFLVVCFAKQGAEICIVSDSEVTVKGITDKRATGPNADLWYLMWAWVNHKSWKITARLGQITHVG